MPHMPRRFIRKRPQHISNHIADDSNTKWCDRNGYISIAVIFFLMGISLTQFLILSSSSLHLKSVDPVIVDKSTITSSSSLSSSLSTTEKTNQSMSDSTIPIIDMIHHHHHQQNATSHSTIMNPIEASTNDEPTQNTSITVDEIQPLKTNETKIVSSMDYEFQQEEKEKEGKKDEVDFPFPDPFFISKFYQAQAGQDKWIFEKLMLSDYDTYRKRSGFFIEFGARNGIKHSNTYFFEHFLGWKGLLIEANPSELEDIVLNRPFSAIVSGAICASTSTSSSVIFLDTGIPGYSGVKSAYDSERYNEVKDQSKDIQVKCYTLDYLTHYFKLEEIDLMTVDTEGSELLALRTFPFDRIQPKLIVVEIHVGNSERNENQKKLISFMEFKGYKVFHELWVSIKKYTLDVFFTLDGKAPIFHNKAMYQYKLEFHNKVAECQEAGICLK